MQSLRKQVPCSAKKALHSRCYLIAKRILDLLLALLLFMPALVIVSACYLGIKLESKGPAFFVQQRPGVKGRIFKIYKLRTMIAETERDGRQLSDMERMTKTGRAIRAFSFDELPQLLNILKGEMSFIGPRPLLVQYLPFYTPQQMRRHDVLPGISGWAQVNGRNEISWEQKFQRDVWYAEHISFALDMKIFCLTIRNVLSHQGINAGVNDTMQLFAGSVDGQKESNHTGGERARTGCC